jgi:hypothetical protein
MCPFCWAALVAQVAFCATIGLLLVVVTDLKFGLPLALTTLALAAGNWWSFWNVRNEVLYCAVVCLFLRAVWVLIKHERNWVRRVALRFGNYVFCKARSISVRRKASVIVPSNDHKFPSGSKGI